MCTACPVSVPAGISRCMPSPLGETAHYGFSLSRYSIPPISAFEISSRHRYEFGAEDIQLSSSVQARLFDRIINIPAEKREPRQGL